MTARITAIHAQLGLWPSLAFVGYNVAYISDKVKFHSFTKVNLIVNFNWGGNFKEEAAKNLSHLGLKQRCRVLCPKTHLNKAP